MNSDLIWTIKSCLGKRLNCPAVGNNYCLMPQSLRNSGCSILLLLSCHTETRGNPSEQCGEDWERRHHSILSITLNRPPILMWIYLIGTFLDRDLALYTSWRGSTGATWGRRCGLCRLLHRQLLEDGVLIRGCGGGGRTRHRSQHGRSTAETQ